MTTTPIHIGNAQGFWGDWPDAPMRLAAQAPGLQVLTLDYLAEVSMSILARQQQKDPRLGYARDFLGVIEALVPVFKQGRRLRIITNAGGLNPRDCAAAVADILRQADAAGVRIAIVTGDDVLRWLKTNQKPGEFCHLETGQPLETVRDRLVTANAYLGAEPIVRALRGGADIVITGRVADPSLTVAPCIAHFDWPATALDCLAGATIAGHLIECGAQVTGGVFTDWLSLPDPANIGYPIAEVHPDGSCIITKPPGTGGRVDAATVKEQLLYEIGDPDNYLSPDATVSFLSLRVEDLGNDRVRVSGARGRPAPPTYKVSATYRAGYRASGMLTLFGRDALAKARRCADIVRDRLQQSGAAPPERFDAEFLGAGSVVPGVLPACEHATELVLRITVADPRKDVVQRFTKELAPLVTTGPQGTTGYAEGRPEVREVFGYWPTLIPRTSVKPEVSYMTT